MILRWLGLRPTSPPSISDLLWSSVLHRSPLLRALPENDRPRLRQLAEGFLQQKTLTAVGGLNLTPLRAALIAAHCCLPLLRLGLDWLQGWREVIVYPGQFRVRRHEVDEAGVIHEWDDELAGEAWERGPVVLSWADVLADLRWPQPGFNVIVHEIAHKLDGRDGAMDGVPPLNAGRRQEWIAAFQSGFDTLNQQLDRGEEPPIDPYAAESADEFFAVATEYHFTAPESLQAAFPAVAAQLRAFYGPSPLDSPR